MKIFKRILLLIAIVSSILLLSTSASCEDDSSQFSIEGESSEETTILESTSLLEEESPTKGWMISTPEAQGMDSNRLARMIQYIENNEIDLRSIVIVRNGYIVTEAYFNPFSQNVKNLIASATKSFTSSLVGYFS